ncbi:MAG: hypothetical protein J07HX64_01347 [halophilic archaeon J07HX64]|jgi:hypothetical protein|nr:MAG: hypothetical protein J07HX64_01347 [halophilic archaeon J07HX64]
MALLDVTAPASIPLRFVAGVLAGFVATLVMNRAMARLPEGATPTSIAAGVLTGQPPGEAPARLATAVHYLAGTLTGPLFVWLLFAGETVFGGPSAPVTVAAAGALYALMVAFFAVAVLPQSRVGGERVGPIRRDWAVSALVYVLVLAPLVGVVSRGL